jgi:hypothetical protein
VAGLLEDRLNRRSTFSRELCSAVFLTAPEHCWQMRSPLGDQCPIIRTEGSLTKAPGVVNRPVPSISWRSMIRIGETVFVVSGCSLIRCGISEPVMKIARSSTFCFRSEVWLVVGSASAVPASMLAATRVATLEDIRTFTNKTTPGKVRCANY